jgi:HSP20 family protein
MNFGSLIPWREKSVPATRDEVADPFVSFRREVDRLFDDFFNGSGLRGLSAWPGAPASVTPTIDVADHDKEIVVTAELPGLDEKDFEVTLAGDVLTIRGEKKAETENRNGDAYYVERRFGSFSRSVRLPFEAGNENVEARYDKGVLTITVPKPADAQRAVRRIDVKAA